MGGADADVGRHSGLGELVLNRVQVRKVGVAPCVKSAPGKPSEQEQRETVRNKGARIFEGAHKKGPRT